MKKPCVWHTRLAWMACIVWLLWLTACASGPKPTVIQTDLRVQANINPDMRGRPSPVVVRFYELKSLTAFNNADFFALFERDRETLGTELVAVDELQLMPNETRQFKRTLQPDTQYIGVVAAFRDLEHSEWRASTTVAPHKVSPLIIQLEANQISIAAP